jgi:hypothetical protein
MNRRLLRFASAGGGNRHIGAARGNQIVTLANCFSVGSYLSSLLSRRSFSTRPSVCSSGQ